MAYRVGYPRAGVVSRHPYFRERHLPAFLAVLKDSVGLVEEAGAGAARAGYSRPRGALLIATSTLCYSSLYMDSCRCMWP